jgi:hypothetical protein
MSDQPTTAAAPRPPSARAAPPNPRMPTPPAQSTAPRPTVTFGKPHAMAGHRIVLYATGGWGKSTLATFAPAPVAVIDLDDSLPILWPQVEAHGLADQVMPVTGIETWPQILAALNGDGWDGIKTIVIDTLTKAEEMCCAEVVRTVPHEKGGKVERIEDYGFGKGLSHVFDTFMPLLAALDRHVKAGRNVVLVCHECANTFPNPMGADYLRYEPRLQSPASGKASIRLRVKEWCDHLLFGAYDVATVESKVGGKTKALGSGSRRIYPQEMPYCMAKSRTLADQMEYDNNAAEIWTMILGK